MRERFGNGNDQLQATGEKQERSHVSRAALFYSYVRD